MEKYVTLKYNFSHMGQCIYRFCYGSTGLIGHGKNWKTERPLFYFEMWFEEEEETSKIATLQILPVIDIEGGLKCHQGKHFELRTNLQTF